MEQVQIHHLKSAERSRYVEDSETGGMRVQTVRRFERSDTDRIVDPQYGTFEVDPDGSFYVPRPVAEFLLRGPEWHPGATPFPPPVEDDEPRARSTRSRKPAAA